MAWLFGLNRPTQSVKPSAAMRIQTALQGTPIAILLGGQNRLPCNLIDYVDFEANPVSNGGGKGVDARLGEIRKLRKECSATIGTVSNPEHNLVTIGKAGRMRWMGRRPQVLGKSMNAVDYPHGGGEGHSPIGLVHPKTPWGKPALGVKTRPRWKNNELIVRRRTKKKRKK